MSSRYVLRRLLQIVPVAFGVLVITFVIVHVIGDPTEIDAEGRDPAETELVRRERGLDRPLHSQFLIYVGNLAQGDLGHSFQGPPVRSLITERLWPTALLMVTALTVSTAVGLGLGLLAARKPAGAVDLAITSGSLLGYAVPSFWLAQLVVYLVVLRTGWFPVEGMTDARANYQGWAHVADVGRHLVLPAFVLAASEVALLARVTRAGLLGQLGSDYVTTARAKGCPPEQVLSRHALPNALLPVVAVLGSRIGFLFSGAVLVEAVFAWPGMGTLLVQSAQGRDQPVVLGMVLLVASWVMLANLVTDMVSARVDPRIRYR